MRIGILIDSSATCEPQILENSVVEWIPLHITFGTTTDILDTKENLTKYQIYEKLAAGEDWKTSQASPGELGQKYDEMLKKYDHIVHIPITENLSSMMGTAMVVANEDQYKDHVTVIRNTTIAAQGIKEMALHLSKLIQAGKLTSVPEIVDEFEKYANSMYIAIIPGNLKKLAAGGRAVKIVSTILNIFRTKVLIVWKEKPEKEIIGRTIASLTERVVEHVKKDFANNYHFILTKTPVASEKNYQAALQVLKDKKISYSEEPIPHLYPVHAGVETIGFIVVPFQK